MLVQKNKTEQKNIQKNSTKQINKVEEKKIKNKNQGREQFYTVLKRGEINYCLE